MMTQTAIGGQKSDTFSQNRDENAPLAPVPVDTHLVRLQRLSIQNLL